MQITKAGSDRLHAVLVALRQGAHGLLQRVQPYVSLVDAGVFELTSAAVGNEETDTWAETMDALGTAEQVLSKMSDVRQQLSIVEDGVNNVINHR